MNMARDEYLTRKKTNCGTKLCGLLMLLGTAGCPPAVIVPPPNGGDEIVDGNRDGAQPGEPNDDFSESVVAVFDANGVARLQGTVEIIGDLDVFLLGGFSPGDRIIVDAFAFDSEIDVSIALFDAEGRLVFANDDHEDASGFTLDSLADLSVRHAGDSYYLVVTHSAFASTGQFLGSYHVDIQKESGVEVPQPVGQTLLLDFNGAIVDSPVLGTFAIEPFDAADISAFYDGDTQTIKDSIRDVFEQNYERFNITILTTDDEPPAPGAEFTVVFFGGFDRGVFGLAENVDLYNFDRCDDAIIFTESFSPAVFRDIPTAVELGIAIGNVGTHEAGHLLGLNHTDDDLDLMDDQSPADAFLEDQEFMEAPLSDDIMPIGTQDGVLLLIETVGPREEN